MDLEKVQDYPWMWVVDLLPQFSYQYHVYSDYGDLATNITLSLRNKLLADNKKLDATQTKTLKDIIKWHSNLLKNAKKSESIYH